MLFKKYGVDAVFAGHDEMYEHSLVDGVHFFDIGIGGDGLRGPYMGEDGKFDIPSNNSYQLFLAHLNAPETWSGNQLTDGGKHYGHLEVNVTFEDGEWRAELTPVYVFPMMDQSGEVIRDISGLPVLERRIYDDVTLIDRAISDLDDDGDTDREDIAIIREYLRQPAENCPNCDIDGDGSITIRDARKIVRMCTRERCCTEAKLLTEPFLQVPTEDSVNVVWFTEFKGSGNALVYGPDVADLMNSDEISLSQLEDYAAGGGNINIVFADTMQLSRTREDSRSNVPGRTYNEVTERQIWRHEAIATDLETAGRSGIPGLPWIPEDYDTYDDPYGLEPIVPTVSPLHDENGPLPYISDNTITTFSILKTEDGTITTYAYDTKDPDSNVEIVDIFSLN